ncbi:MAG TPA: SCO family protein [Gammaproteobacteria bacterium]|nr:SCO family protein [Gammaproteobacteria bacterium]
MSNSSPRAQLSFLVTSLCILALLFGLWLYHNLGHHEDNSDTQLVSATVFQQPRALTPFNLTDDNDHPFTLDNFKGHWSLLFFGFTNCPDLCPTTLSVLNQAYKQLASTNPKTMPQVVFISVDPEQDDSQTIAKYLSSFNPSFLGATGSQSTLDQLTRELNVLYMKVAPPQANTDEHYSIDHSGTILIINPQGQFYGVFTTPHDPNKIAKDTQTLMAALEK